jgi:hypothetical protein
MDEISKSFKALIDATNSILILLPKDPYLDQVASGLSLFLSLKDKKDISIACPTPMVVEFNRLVGVDKITPDVGNKNLVFRIKSFNPDNVERVTYDVDTAGEMQLVLIPKSGQKPPMKDQVTITYSGISAQTVILIGGMNDSHFPAISSKDFSQSKLVHRGTHELKIMEAKEILSFAKPSSSISEIVTSLLKEAEFDINSDIATNLLLGIQEGSKNFTHREVSAQTFEIAALLMKKGAKFVASAPQSQPKFQNSALRSAFGLNPLERPQAETTNPNTPPASWTQPPKILKGTSIS